LAFKYYEETANEDLVAGQLFTGYCYSNGIGIKKDSKMAVNNGNIIAIYNLDLHYQNGMGVENKILYGK